MDDIAVFFRALGGLIDGFSERAAGVKALLADTATTFLIVTSPEREPVAEAIFFRGKLREARMRVRRADRQPRERRRRRRARTPSRAELRAAGSATRSPRRSPRAAADLQLLAARDAEQIERLKAELDEPDPIVVPRLDGEVQDIDGLLALRDALL